MAATYNNQGTILVVEDNDKINRMFCKQLAASGFACTGVASVQEALRYLETEGLPAVMILDLELEDGTEVLDYMRHHALNTCKVVVVSANAFSREHNISAYKTDHVLLKPVSPRGLSALIHDFFK